MPTIAKHTPSTVSLKSSAQLFGQLGKVLSNPDIIWQIEIVRAALSKSLQQLRKHMSGAEMEVLSKVVRELAYQVDRLVSPGDIPVPPASNNADAWTRAQADDVVGEQMLGVAARRRPVTMSTRQSIRQGDEAVARA